MFYMTYHPKPCPENIRFLYLFIVILHQPLVLCRVEKGMCAESLYVVLYCAVQRRVVLPFVCFYYYYYHFYK